MSPTFKLKLETITPVCIGDGNKLSSYVDYIFKNDTVYYLNHEVIKKRLASNPDLIDEYVDGIARGVDNTTNQFNLESFLYNRLRLSLEDASIRKTHGDVSGKKELNTIIKNPLYQPYIPGSTLKGAIKTAFLYDWLCQPDNPWCENYLEAVYNNEEKEILRKFETRLNNKLRKYELAVSDSIPFSTENMEVLEINRIHLKRNDRIPQTWEAISKNNTTSFEIRNLNIVQEKDNDIVCNTWEDLCDIINNYSYEVNQNEKDILEQLKKHVDSDLYEKLMGFYDKIAGYTESTTAAYLRIGNSKGYFFNTIGLELYYADDTKDKSLFLSFLHNNKYKKVKDANKFPITRSIKAIDDQPLGWVKLTLEK